MYTIETVIGFVRKSFTLCETGEVKMDVWVVTCYGLVDSVWSTEQKTKIRCQEIINSGEPEGPEYAKLTINVAYKGEDGFDWESLGES